MNLVIGVGLAVFTLVGVPGVVRDWRAGPQDRRFRPPAAWPWGSAAWIGLRRPSLVGEIGILILAVGLAVPSLLTVCSVAFFFALLLALSVVMFKRPERVVPRALRRGPRSP
jgi:hypothetical protein